MIKSKKKAKELLKEIPNLYLPNFLTIMNAVSNPFDRVPIPVHGDRRINHTTRIKGSCQEMVKENFKLGKEEVNDIATPM